MGWTYVEVAHQSSFSDSKKTGWIAACHSIPCEDARVAVIFLRGQTCTFTFGIDVWSFTALFIFQVILIFDGCSVSRSLLKNA